MDQSQIADITEIQQLLARYAIGMTSDDIDAVIDVFTPDGTYSAFGDTYALTDFPSLVAAAPKGLFLTGTPMENRVEEFRTLVHYRLRSAPLALRLR